MKTMQIDRFGGPEVLHAAEAPEPHAGPGPQARASRGGEEISAPRWENRPPDEEGLTRRRRDAEVLPPRLCASAVKREFSSLCLRVS